MVIKVHNPKYAVGKNTGSVRNLVEYLDKENRELEELDKDYFFNKDGSHFSAAVVEREIDNNQVKLKKTDTKFYMITVNPSQEELNHIRHDEVKFKSYINDLMDKYAENFNRTFKDGRPLTGDDILYYAKIEHERTYKFGEKRFKEDIAFNKDLEKKIYKNHKNLKVVKDPKQRQQFLSNIKDLESKYVRNSEGTIIKEGNLKDGHNLHAHVIISRMDKSREMLLSPMANPKQAINKINGIDAPIGFDRDNYVQMGEKLFDQKFEYKRDYKKSYSYYKETKQIRVVGNLLHLSNPKAFAKMAVKRAMSEMIQDKTLQKQLGHVVTDPRKFPKKVAHKLEQKVLEAVIQKMGMAAYSNPITAGVQVAKQAITIASKTLSRGMGI
ncbi:hypothetical protein FVB32_05290 [Flagellimonas hymeniacidonis]|uniref:Mobilization protein n=1 Tax=Flagellimonas hymeniacidonis TaxID=2603628 RepID=A0A5C8V8N4_9FLAO|nr:MobB family relaxase [Flagellimonas hymeniacidonis]TXN37703.1 hypothetical protein FVB32_05290 [Flagellimonas hymeniacidonis]